MTRPPVSTSGLGAFSDRVMAVIATLDAPSPTRSFLVAIRTGSVRDALTALTVAWHLATQRDWPVAPRVRARSLALVLGVATVLGTGSIMAASAARVLAPHVRPTELLEERGSIIFESTPDQVVPKSSGRPALVPVPGTTPGVGSVLISKKVPITTSKHPSVPTRAKPAAHEGTTAPDDGADGSDEGRSADDTNAADGSRHGDDGADGGSSSHDGDSDHGGSGGSDGGDGHQGGEDGRTTGD
jgi:uncharacterized membrane protein YgcG